ncbi:ABC transporter ATP-binding protein [Actinomycetota bacterium]|nr:ABC transporter ATP-binding protein [Actinomycetota bacterium]
MRLIAHGVSVRFPGRDDPVLDRADLEVRTGETVAILGPSGSGKSTLLSVLGGLLRPETGTVELAPDGGAVAAPGGSGEEVSVSSASSWILQTTNVLPERTAVENVAVAASLAGSTWNEALGRAREALALVGLGDHAGDQVRVLSGGEVQRVVTARALVAGRPFVLADEPTGQLDRATTEVVLDALFASVRAHLTTGAETGLVVVTHDPAVAARCDRSVRIDNGRVVA